MIKFDFLEKQSWLRIYSAAEKAVKDFKMEDLIRKGVLVGFSGGADSLTLLLFLTEYRKRNGYFPLAAAHVNHMIRAGEADRDEEFSRQVCDFLNVPFFLEKIDIPGLAKESRKGIEETARVARYVFFKKIIEAHNEYKTVATAHNATDNLETVIFNMMRGSGTVGLSGISPVRENVIRPLIYISGTDIREALKDANIEFAVDSTNLSSEYTRNYIRHEILPKLTKLNAAPERMGTRLSQNLSDDADYIDSVAEEFLDKNFNNDKVEVTAILGLHRAVLFRVVTKMIKRTAFDSKTKSRVLHIPERSHIDLIESKLPEGDFSYDLPGGVSFVSERGFCFITPSRKEATDKYLKILPMKLSYGLNKFEGFSTAVLISESKDEFNYSNVYKIAIQKSIPFDIINGSLYLRCRLDGDSYKYAGITHKIKKLFNDRKIPCEFRDAVPIICDDDGILWVAGFSHRDGNSVKDRKIYISLLEPLENDSFDKRFYY